MQSVEVTDADTLQATIAWKALSVTAKDRKGAEKHLLDNLSGGLQPTGMLAIM